MFGDLVPVGIVEVLGEVRKRVQVRGEVGVVALKEEAFDVVDVPSVKLNQAAYFSYHSLHVVVGVAPQEDVVRVVGLGVVSVVKICVSSEFLLAPVTADRPEPIKLCS